MSKSKRLPFWSMSLLITGNVLGVGILALPVKTGLSGAIPTLLGIIGLWAMMCFTALIIAKRIKRAPDGTTTFDIPSFFHKELGTVGRWIAIIANLILLYGVLTAYLSMISSMIDALFPSALSQRQLIVIYFIIMSCLTLFGMKMLRRSNFILMIVLWSSFIFLLFMITKEFNASRLLYTKWELLPAGLPIIVSAFHFHNIIPTVCRSLEFDHRMVRKSIITGTFIGLIMNSLWVIMVLGGLPLISHFHESIIYAYYHGEPATVPLSVELHSQVFTIIGSLFALLSVTASFMANGTGLLGFVRDLAHSYFKIDRKLIVDILAFMPPLLIALSNPKIFLSALSVVGGVGEIILFGVLPALIVIKYAYRKRGEPKIMLIPGGITLIVSTFILCYQLFF